MPNKRGLMTRTKIKEPVRGVVTGFGHLDHQYNNFLGELDLAPGETQSPSAKGRAVRIAMAASEDNRFRTFLEMLGKPNKRTLAAIAKHCNISLVEFMDFTKKACNMQIVARSITGVLDLTEDLIQDGHTKQANCPRCDGMKFVWSEALPESLAKKANVRVVQGTRKNAEGDEVPADLYFRECPACNGTGKVAIEGSTDARKLLMDQAGTTAKKQGAGVTINFGGAGIESAIGRMKDITFDLEGAE
jgi:hypothetical protein